MMITSLFKFVWNAIVWFLPIFLSAVIFFVGGESNKGLSTLFAVVYLTATLCMSFVIKGEFVFVLAALGLAVIFAFVLHHMIGG